MSFINHRLDLGAQPGFQGGPEWNTVETPLKSGISLFTPRWSMPRFKYVAEYTKLDKNGQFQVYNAFVVARGRASSFRYRDRNDFFASDVLIGIGEGNSNPIQLVKIYSFGGTEYSRKISLPVAGTVVVKEAGVEKEVSVGETGLVTPSSPWSVGAEITASFQFDTKVRFGADYYPFVRVSANIVQCTIDLVEEKE